LPANWYDLSLYDRQNYVAGDSALPPESAGTFRRDKTCLLEIWQELFRGSIVSLDDRARANLRSAMTGVEGWCQHKNASGKLRFADYGIQRAYSREGERM
jgi:hypothetical protein